VIFNLPNISEIELRRLFSKYGEIKEIRETPNKRYHRFIEFFDVRDAERAMKQLNKTEIMGKKIKIEPSRPGGTRKTTPSPPSPKVYQPFSAPVPSSAPAYTGLFGDYSFSLPNSTPPQPQHSSQERTGRSNRSRSNHEDKRRFHLNMDSVKNGIDTRTSK
jgi:RNA recognition motif-containing protein